MDSRLSAIFCWCLFVSGSALTDGVATTTQESVTSAGQRNETRRTTQTTTTPSSTTAGNSDETACSSFMDRDQGSYLRSSDRVLVQCQCSTKGQRVQLCPDWKFISGEELVLLEEELFDSSSGEYCSVTYKFRVKKDLKVGKKPVQLKCYLPYVKGAVESYYVYVDSPYPESKTRLSVYMIFAIVCFLILTISLFGFLFRWQARHRRRTRRAAACRTPFVFNAANHNGFFNSPDNAGYVHDTPPSYNEATLPQSGPPAPPYTSICPVGGKTVQERIEKITNSTPAQSKQG